MGELQSPGVVQVGSVTSGNAAQWIGNNTVIDGGPLNTMTFATIASGGSSVIPDGNRFYIIGNGSLILAMSLTMPPNPVDTQRVTVSSKSAVTSFTMSANTGQTLYGGLTTILGGGFATWIYRAADTSWYRIA